MEITKSTDKLYHQLIIDKNIFKVLPPCAIMPPSFENKYEDLINSYIKKDI